MISSQEIDELLASAKKKRQQLGPSRVVPPPTLTELTAENDDVDTIQTQFETICNNFRYTQSSIEDSIELVKQTDFIMNLLNYKMYETQYVFITKFNELTEKKGEAKNVMSTNEMNAEMKRIDEKIDQTERRHEKEFDKVKQQKLEVQKIYESTITYLDNTFAIVKKYAKDLRILMPMKKDLDNADSTADFLLLDEVEEIIEKYGEMQSRSWKTKHTRDISEKPNDLKMTKEGLLVTETGRIVNLDEVRENQLLDFIDQFERMLTIASDKTSSTGSTLSGMSSDNVEYLKQKLGFPLTLALAEITAKQPRDPIHYLGHWLFKFRYNQEINDQQMIEHEQLNAERKRLAKERWKTFVEDEARHAVLMMILKAEEEITKQEMLRTEMEEMEGEDEEEMDGNLSEEAKDKFEGY